MLGVMCCTVNYLHVVMYKLTKFQLCKRKVKFIRHFILRIFEPNIVTSLALTSLECTPVHLCVLVISYIVITVDAKYT